MLALDLAVLREWACDDAVHHEELVLRDRGVNAGHLGRRDALDGLAAVHGEDAVVHHEAAGHDDVATALGDEVVRGHVDALHAREEEEVESEKELKS